MKTRIISAAVIIPFALAVLLIFPVIVLTLVLSVVSAVAAYELFTAMNRLCKKPPSKSIIVCSLLVAAIVPVMEFTGRLLGMPPYFGVLTAFFILFCAVTVDFFLSLKSEKRIRLLQLPVSLISAIIIPFMLSSLISLRIQDAGVWLVLLPVIVTVFTDSGAYFTGVLIGKHKPLPKISPNKTIEGFAGGIVTGTAALLCYGLILTAASSFNIHMIYLLVYGITGAVVTEAGDLVFSLVKRKCGIKDYGKLIPGHGGALDRFDSLIFTAPVMYMLVTLIPVVS